jgi:streptogrisin D
MSGLVLAERVQNSSARCSLGFVRSDCPGADSGLLTRPNGTGPGAINTGQKITSAAAPVVGERISKQGSTTGGGTGMVKSVDQSVNVDVGVLNREFGTTAHTDHGDSGGPAYDGAKGLGTLSGGDTVTSYFYPLTRELQRYGLTLA